MLNIVLELNDILLNEMPQYKSETKSIPKTYDEQRGLLRSLMNVRPPMPLRKRFILLQDKLLSQETIQKHVIDVTKVIAPSNPNIYLWKGDITRLKVDAIVNAANSALLGCFIPHHRCIDNAIHSAAGLQLRQDCHEIMLGQHEKTGGAKITPAYNLPSKYIIHTVGPIISAPLTTNDCDLLANCYKSCLDMVVQHNLNSIAFCCISTGEFKFPNREAAQIAIKVVKNFLKSWEKEVVFCVFKEIDYEIYNELLS